MAPSRRRPDPVEAAVDEVTKGASRLAHAAREAGAEASIAVRGYLASQEGQRLRRRVAGVLIVGAPLVARMPVIRRNPIARAIGFAGVAALVVKWAERLRDWEPLPPRA